MTPAEVATSYGKRPDGKNRVSIETVYAWISSGELVAENLATKPNGRARWDVSEAALEEFRAKRRNETTPRHRKKVLPRTKQYV